MNATPGTTSPRAISVLASCDDNYAQHLGVLILSVLKNAAAPGRIDFYVIDNAVGRANRLRMQELADSYGSQLTFLPALEAPFAHVDVGRYGSAALQRLAMAEMLPDSVEQVIYLDSDMVVLGDIAQLDNLGCGGFPVAAVENLSPKPSARHRFKRSGYFNSGMLIADLRYWREHDVKGAALGYLGEYGADSFPDQSALNRVFAGQWHRLPLSWNLQVDAFGVLRKYFDDSCGYSAEELIQAIARPDIIHFIGRRKPWLWDCHSAYKAFYEHYKNSSPWKDEPRPDASVANALRHTFSFRKKYRQWRRYKNLAIRLEDLR